MIAVLRLHRRVKRATRLSRERMPLFPPGSDDVAPNGYGPSALKPVGVVSRRHLGKTRLSNINPFSQDLPRRFEGRIRVSSIWHVPARVYQGTAVIASRSHLPRAGEVSLS